MEFVGAAGSLILAVVFLVAAVAKLADLEGTRSAVEQFGVPRALATSLGTLLPWAELAVVGLLVSPATAFGGALAAGVLLLLFSAALAANLARGRTPDCHCFGQVGASPVSWATLARNTGLLAIATLAAVALAAEPDAAAIGLLDRVDTVAVALILAGVGFVAAGLAAWGMLHVLRAHGRLLLRIDQLEASLTAAGVALPKLGAIGIPAGSPAPKFTAVDVAGRLVTRESLLGRGQPLLLVFTDTGCASCHDLLAELARWQQDNAGDLTVAVAAGGSVEDIRNMARDHALEHVLLDEREELFHAHGARATPSAILIGINAHVAAPLAMGPEEIRDLRARAIAGPADPTEEAMRLVHRGDER